MLIRVADHLSAIRGTHPLRVAVDGITAAGKTTLADELAAELRSRGVPVAQVSMDGYHHPRAHRHRQDHDPARGYYEDAHDFAALRAQVLDPLGSATGPYGYRPAILDLATDEVLPPTRQTIESDTILLVDGTFLQRPETTGAWDVALWVEVAYPIAEDRAAGRDAGLFGGPEAARAAYRTRYHAACRHYVDQVDPRARAQIVVANDSPERASLQRIGGAAGANVEVFSYGTLQQTQVQVATFGRVVNTVPDDLPGHRLGWVQIRDQHVVATSGSDRHPIVEPAEPQARVTGSVLTLTAEELAAADTYEVESYQRIGVTLASGRSAWVYASANITR